MKFLGSLLTFLYSEERSLGNLLDRFFLGFLLSCLLLRQLLAYEDVRGVVVIVVLSFQLLEAASALSCLLFLLL